MVRMRGNIFRTVSVTIYHAFIHAEQANYLQFLPHADTRSDYGTLQICDDCTSSKISLPDDFPFGGYFHDSAYVRQQKQKQCMYPITI